MIYKQVLEDIELGIKGENVGLSIGLPRTSEFIPNVQRGNLYLIGGETASGKSAFAMNSFVYNPYEDWLQNYTETTKLKIFVWSMEMDKRVVVTKAICRKLWQDYKILTDVNYVLSRGKNRISQEVYDKVKQVDKYFEGFEDIVTILNAENPTGIRHIIQKYMLSIGEDSYKKISITNKAGETEEISVYDTYKPYHPNQYVICIFDHVALLKTERGFSKKEKIDKLVDYMIDYRDRYRITPVFVQQLNRDMSSTDRFKQNRVEPQISDFKESSDTTDGANFVLALFSPNRYEFSTYRDFNIDAKAGGLGDRFRSVKILKSRDGSADKVIGLGFLGEIGSFVELPKAEDMKDADYKYINSLKKIT